jgi:sugar phosphate permease
MGETSPSRETDITTPAPERPTWVRWQIVALLMAYSFMNWFNRVSFSVADDPIRQEFGLSSTQIGIIDFMMLFWYMLFMTPGGWFIDRFGPKTALTIMGLGSAAFVAVTGLAGHPLLGLHYTGVAFSSFLIIRAAMGSFSAPIYPASGKMVSHWIPFTRRAWANGLITGAAPLGMAASHVVFGFFVDQYTWRNAFFITGSATAVLAVVWMAYATNYPGQHHQVNQAERHLIESSDHAMAERRKAAGQTWVRLLRNRSIVLLTLSYAAVGYFEYLFNFCSEFYFKDVLAIPLDTSRQYAAYGSLAQAFTMPLGGLLSDLLVHRFGYRFGRASVPVAAMLVSAASLFAATLTRDAHWTLLCFVVANAAIAATEGSFWTTAIDLGGRWGATSGGIVNTGGNAGGALAPWVSRGLGDLFHGDWRPAFYIGSLVCFCGVLLWGWIDPRERVPDSEGQVPEPPAPLGAQH